MRTGTVLVTLGEAALDDPPLLVFEYLGPVHLATAHGYRSDGKALPSGERMGRISGKLMNGRAATVCEGDVTFSAGELNNRLRANLGCRDRSAFVDEAGLRRGFDMRGRV